MRLVIADPIDTQPLEELRVLGIEIVEKSVTDKEGFARALADASVLVVRGSEITAEVLASAKKLNLIVRAGSGLGNIDVPAASARGIYVANCPGKNAASVAELVFGMMLALDRRLIEATKDLADGHWDKTKYASEMGLMGRRIGIAGLGGTGREVLSRARAFGLVPHVYSRSLSLAKATRLEVGFAATMRDLAAKSDILTIHLPLNEKTRGIVSREVIAAIPDGAIVINTSRSEVIDHAALLELAESKRLRCGFDVFPNEPRGRDKCDYPFLKKPGFVGTPHIAASTKQAQRAIAQEVARIVRSFLTEENVPNVVNVCATSPARYVVVLRQLDQVGALANTLGVLKRHGINIEEISNTVFDGARAVCTKLRVETRPSDACLKEIAAFEETLHVDVVSMPIRA
jgi:D-3-phosphoglycerate dehydrogenase / 2-oxoglutarate reductase